MITPLSLEHEPLPLTAFLDTQWNLAASFPQRSFILSAQWFSFVDEDHQRIIMAVLFPDINSRQVVVN